MTQRNLLNERYSNTDEKRTGKTRKSSASAKPKAQRAATVREPAPKTAKQKKDEARERERKAAQKAGVMQSIFEDTPEYKRLRRIWWVALGVAIGCTAISFAFQQNEDTRGIAMALMIIAYSAIIIAFYIDFGKIRKERKKHTATIATGKSKEARREQKKIRAEMRAQEKEAAEKFEAAKEEEQAKSETGLKGFFGRFGKKQSDPEKASEEDAESGK